MAKIRNEITKTNPAHLTRVLELHEDVEFDLFHGGWPFMGEFLFLGKNYPNVSLDMCWAHAIDPKYSVELLERALMTIPYTKIMGFGGDTGKAEWTVGYLLLAKDNIAMALSSMIDLGWIDGEAAERIAASWLYDNPNRLFRLGLPMRT
jgi:predicted TIM-barrel fold metal-dependent hydrolase